MFDIRDFLRQRLSEPSKERLPLLFGYFVIFGGSVAVSVVLTALMISGYKAVVSEAPPQKSYTEERLDYCISNCNKLGMVVGLFSTHQSANGGGNECYCKY